MAFVFGGSAITNLAHLYIAALTAAAPLSASAHFVFTFALLIEICHFRILHFVVIGVIERQDTEWTDPQFERVIVNHRQSIEAPLVEEFLN